MKQQQQRNLEQKYKTRWENRIKKGKKKIKSDE